MKYRLLALMMAFVAADKTSRVGNTEQECAASSGTTFRAASAPAPVCTETQAQVHVSDARVHRDGGAGDDAAANGSGTLPLPFHMAGRFEPWLYRAAPRIRTGKKRFG